MGKPGSGTDPAALLRIYLKFDRLEEAAELVVTEARAWREVRGRPPSPVDRAAPTGSVTPSVRVVARPDSPARRLTSGGTIDLSLCWVACFSFVF